MQEILPGMFVWSTFHEGIGERVYSCFVSACEPAILIDPRVPEEGIEWFAKNPPAHAYLTNRHHYRHSGQFAQRYSTEVWCHKDGLHEFTHGETVRAFDHGDELPGGVRALAVGVLCPEETALYLPQAGGLLAIGDAIIRHDGKLGFVPDAYMGEDPEGVKRGLREVFLEHLELDFDSLLFAHGKPWIGGARQGLRDFLTTLPG